jgi:hypothetical protein
MERYVNIYMAFILNRSELSGLLTIKKYCRWIDECKKLGQLKINLTTINECIPLNY